VEVIKDGLDEMDRFASSLQWPSGGTFGRAMAKSFSRPCVDLAWDVQQACASRVSV